MQSISKPLSYGLALEQRGEAAVLARMGATLANGGLNPLTGERAIAQGYVGNVLSVMATCGMYDASGDWLYRSGLPAKSGVGGGILAVQPGRLAIAVFSPPLDAQGNSVRGIAVCQELAADLGLHLFDASQKATPVVRMFTTRRNVASKQRRPAAVMGHLKGVGRRLRLYHLQGALVFASAEQVIRRLMERSADSDVFCSTCGWSRASARRRPACWRKLSPGSPTRAAPCRLRQTQPACRWRSVSCLPGSARRKWTCWSPGWCAVPTRVGRRSSRQARHRMNCS